jgi:hypothetical protein
METNDELDPNTKRKKQYQDIKDKKMQKEGKHMQRIKKQTKKI